MQQPSSPDKYDVNDLRPDGHRTCGWVYNTFQCFTSRYCQFFQKFLKIFVGNPGTIIKSQCFS